jgi:electron transport complex protein RnfG
VKKDKGIFDQFTGATITPRAVIRSIHNSLLFYQQHQKTLLEQAHALTTHAANSPSDTQEQAQ